MHNQKFTVATLSTATPQASLDLNFSDGDRVYFYAVGNGHLSILGYALSIQQPASYVSYRNMPPGGLHADSWFYDGDEDSADSVATYRTLSDSYMLDSSEDSMDSSHTQSAPEADNRSTETDENKANSQVDTVYELSSDNERPGVIIEELYPTPATEDREAQTSTGLNTMPQSIEVIIVNEDVNEVEYVNVDVNEVDTQEINENDDRNAEIANDYDENENVIDAEQNDNDGTNDENYPIESSASTDEHQSPPAKRTRLSSASDAEQ
ncbi:PREDICTED: uncharacterized protein LOC108619490 [Drosophila arizonae]|uniref:Uncharacterized protein LOC108619490 n=1 Tax=Drosophila arizonae TaxID=7263 RepID=A0ABM1PWK8_DROAR|nr:PREDICTED: uncharacterized protein LOC108619490 [Drosophila arizonae]